MTSEAKLTAILRAAGREVFPLDYGAAGRLLILREGARVIGLFPGGDDCGNALWTHPALAREDSARAYMARPGWPNPGGDRTWLAPETEFFMEGTPVAVKSYLVPPTLDPGAYRNVGTALDPYLVTEADLVLRRTHARVTVQILKSWAPAINPLAARPDLAGCLAYAGYTQHTTLSILDGDSIPVSLPGIGLWNLLQLPLGGHMLAPTNGPAAWTTVFGEPPTAETQCDAVGWIWHMRGILGAAKVALKAQSVTGRAGYVYPGTDGKGWFLVIRAFNVEPDGNYVDDLWSNPEDRGYAFQACRVAEKEQAFAELEYHVPAIAPVRTGSQCVDESRVWAFYGAAEAVAEASVALLGLRPGFDATNVQYPTRNIQL